MSVKPLIQLERESFLAKNTLLRAPCENVTDFGPQFAQQIEDLVDTLMHHKIAIGLAAPQIGISKRFCAINLKQADSKTIILVNPEMISTGGKKDKKKESCMSLPHFRGEVERRETVKISFCTITGEPQLMEAKGFLARVIFHELDHLDGILYIDLIKDLLSLEPVSFFNE